MIRLSDIKLSLGQAVDRQMEMDSLRQLAIKKLKINEAELSGLQIFKKSIDARKKDDIHYVYTIDIALHNEEKLLNGMQGKGTLKGLTQTPDLSYKLIDFGSKSLEERPIIVGAGPAGLFAGLMLAKYGYKPIIVERGDDVDRRTEKINSFWSLSDLDTESNVQFGEGGAGTFSDGKLTTLINDIRCRTVLEEFIKAGAPAEILYKNKPHIGTDILKTTVKNIRQEIIALAAVGASMPVLNLLLVLFMGISVGAGIMVSQYFGAKNKELLSKTVGTCISLTFIASLLMMVAGYFLSGPIMIALNTPMEIRDMSIQYLQIIFIGIMSGAFYNIMAGVLRGMGDSFYPLFFLLIATVINIYLDILFVSQFKMGVPGVAWATIIAQSVSAVLCILRMMTMKTVITLDRKAIRLDKGLAIQLGKLGMPAGITQAIFSLSAIMVQNLVNTLGTQVIAASLVVMRVDGFCMMPNFTFGAAATTFVGQNIGAGRMDRVHQGTREALKLGFFVSIMLTLGLLFYGANLMHMFTNSQELIAIGVRGMRTLAVGYIVFAGTQILTGVMRGAGDTMRPMWISIFTTVVLRMPAAYIWAWLSRSDVYPNGSPDSLFASLLIAWVSGFLVTVIVYRGGAWKNKSIVAKQAA